MGWLGRVVLSLRGQIVLLFAFGLAACHRAGPAENRPLTTADAVRRLSWEAASGRPPVRLSGTVTVIDTFTQVMFIQDGTGAVWATLPVGMPNLPGGSTIELSGTAMAIGQDRAIIYPSLGRAGPGKQPETRLVAREDLTSEPKNYSLGRLRMRIKAVLPAAGREIRFSGEMSGGPIEVSLLHPPTDDIRDLVGQEVDLVGVPAPPTQVSTSALPLFLADSLTPLVAAKKSTTRLRLLTTIREVKALSGIEARRSYPVALRGVVTTSAPDAYMLTIQDATGAVYLDLDPRLKYPPYGFRVRVEGVTLPGDAATSIAVSKIIVEDRALMPAPVELARFKVNDVRLDNLRVHFEGVVRWVAPDPLGGYRLIVATPQFRTAVLARSGTAKEAALFVPGTAVSLEGVYSPLSDRFRHWRDFQVYTPSLDAIRIQRASAGAGSGSKPTYLPLRSLFGYGMESSPMVPIHVRGVVTLSGPDGNIYISDGEGGVQVVPVAGRTPVKPGTLVEVTGFLPNDPSQRRIEDATWKVVGGGRSPEAPIIQPESALDGSYESRWVRLEGQLTHRQQAIEYSILVLQSPSALVNVYSTAPPDAAWRSLRVGSTLLVRGVVLPALDKTGLTGSRTVSILIGSSQDVQVIRMASWWTPEHLTTTLITASALLFGLFLISSALVRRVLSQSRIIGKKLEIEAALKAEAQAASRAKSQFLASMSHEIRTPMNGILGLTELALQTAGQPEQLSYLQNAFQSARSLMGILNDVLDLAKIESGKMTLAEESFAFSMMLQPVIAPAIQQCKAKGVQFICVVAPDVPEMMIGDAMRLRQIVANLLSNACKFTHKGRIEVEASAEDMARECFSLVLHVRDTGIGVAPDQIGRIFDAFEQADRSDSRRYGGTGLGLAICQNLAHLMGGQIEVISKLDEGSDFCVRLPMRREIVPSAPAGGTVAPPEPAVPEGGVFQPLKILAAEDNRINRLLLGRILEKAGHQAVFADNGVEALRLWEIGDFDVLLMDLQMPVMDGLEAAQEIRRREAGNSAHTPIIAVTARAMHEDRDLTVAAGMDGYVSKPYAAEDILAAIRKVVHQPNRGAAR